MVELTGSTLTIREVVQVAREYEEVASLSADVTNNMLQSQIWIKEKVQEGTTLLYGVNTGFGPLANQSIPQDQTQTLSRNVILACAVGLGPPLPIDVVRAMMLIRANTLTKGYSGARPVVAQTLIDMLNAGVTPFIPSKGSLGASGDLAPLAHMAVVMIRSGAESGDEFSGKAWYQNELMGGAEAMERAGIPSIVLEAKEGLALTNGTSFMAASAALTLFDAEGLIQHHEIAAALSLEALLGLSDAFFPGIHTANNQPGQIKSARNIRNLINGSQLIDSDPGRVQDAYSLRCTPQVIGPSRDIVDFLRGRVVDAINSANDNPLIFEHESEAQTHKLVSGGNFHGEGLAMWLDFLGIAMSSIGNISERRTFRLLTPSLSAGLPSMLVPEPGLDSGMMMVQYTAAALVSDNKTLAHPDSVDSIPSSANQEDYVSMGANAARHTMEIIDNVRSIIAIELLCAAQGVDLREHGPKKLAPAPAAAHAEIRAVVDPLEHDREQSSDIEAIVDLIQSGKLLKAVTDVVGEDF